MIIKIHMMKIKTQKMNNKTKEKILSKDLKKKDNLNKFKYK